MQLGESPVASAPPMWPPPPPVGFWPTLGPGFWRSSPQTYPGQLGGTAPPQMGQGYWLSPKPWGSPPGGQALLPFGSPPLRTSLLQPMTSTPPRVRQTYVKICFICLWLLFIPNTSINMSFRAADGTTRQWAGIQLHRQPLQPDRRIRQQRCGAIVLVLVSLVVVLVLLLLVMTYIVLNCQRCFTFACHKLYCGFAVVYDYSCIFCMFWRLPVWRGRQNRQ
jgi:hypothetical protein